MRAVLAAVDRGDTACLAKALRRRDVLVDVAPDMNDALSLIADYSCDALVLGAGAVAPGLAAAIRKIRQRDPKIALMVAGVTAPADRLACFNAGADEVLAPNCDGDEVVARLHAIVRRSMGHSSACVTVGNLTLDISGATIMVEDRRMELTRKEFRMLEMLVLQAGNSISKAKLLDGLYFGGEERDEGIIGVFLCMLRKKLREAGAQVVIETFRGVGYTLRAEGDAAAPGRVARRAAPEARPRFPELAPAFLPANGGLRQTAA